jgi:acetyl-CoA carboxylase biotin carboxyl carrier protein
LPPRPFSLSALVLHSITDTVFTLISTKAPLDLKEIKQIIDLMKRSDLSEFAVEEEGFKLQIKRGSGEPQIVTTAAPSVPAPQQVVAPPPVTAAAPEPATEEKGVSYITSPMVGTFYRASSPETPPLTDVNQAVQSDSVVCIIEAMKIMNEIQAEMNGTVLEALVENGQPVEYGQRLFKVKTN